MPGSLNQPDFILPLAREPFGHIRRSTYWLGHAQTLGSGRFCPSEQDPGLFETEQFAVAVADGVVARIDPGTVMLDLDGDGDERTGWVILYLHVAEEGRVKLGDLVKKAILSDIRPVKAVGQRVRTAYRAQVQRAVDPAASSVLPLS